MEGKKLVLFFLISFLRISSAVKLPGPCPKAQPTDNTLPGAGNNQKRQTYFPEILYVVPFSCLTPSYLFHEMNGFLEFVWMEIQTDESSFLDRIGLEIAVQGTDEFLMLVSEVDKKVKHNEYLSVTSTMQIFNDTRFTYAPVPCLPELQEEIRVWIWENFLMIWSCVEDKDGSGHDEAVILGWFPEWTFVSTDNKILMHELKMKAEGYLGQELINTIDWNYPPQYGYKPNNFYPCPKEENKEYSTRRDKNTS